MDTMPLLLILAGFVVLWLASEALIRGAVTTAHALSVPPIIIGLTVISVGTSAPELTVSLSAALEGQTDIAIGNVIGSNIANILLILGVAAAVRPFVLRVANLGRDGGVMLGVSLLLLVLGAWGVIAPLVGAGLLVLFAAYIIYLYYMSRGEVEAEADEGVMNGGLWSGVPVLVIGLVGIIVGAEFMVAGAVDFAEQIGVSSGVIALGLVAIGTSLPELAVSVAAVMRGQAALAVGNVIGSNISNILLILGASASVVALPFPAEMLARDIWIMLAAALLGIYAVGRGSMGRAMASFFLVLYVGYIVLLFV